MVKYLFYLLILVVVALMVLVLPKNWKEKKMAASSDCAFRIMFDIQLLCNDIYHTFYIQREDTKYPYLRKSCILYYEWCRHPRFYSPLPSDLYCYSDEDLECSRTAAKKWGISGVRNSCHAIFFDRGWYPV